MVLNDTCGLRVVILKFICIDVLLIFIWNVCHT